MFTITERIPRQLHIYRIADYDGEKLDGTFYKQEIERVNKSETDYYRVEKVLRTGMRNKCKEYFVKWLGYSETFNSWVPAENVKDVKK